jgi:hypothetical protein
VVVVILLHSFLCQTLMEMVTSTPRSLYPRGRSPHGRLDVMFPWTGLNAEEIRNKFACSRNRSPSFQPSGSVHRLERFRSNSKVRILHLMTIILESSSASLPGHPPPPSSPVSITPSLRWAREVTKRSVLGERKRRQQKTVERDMMKRLTTLE